MEDLWPQNGNASDHGYDDQGGLLGRHALLNERSSRLGCGCSGHFGLVADSVGYLDSFGYGFVVKASP